MVSDSKTIQGLLFANPPRDLGAIIWTPQDFKALIAAVSVSSLPAQITSFAISDLSGRMSGVPAPTLSASLKASVRLVEDINVFITARGLRDLPVKVTASFSGDTGFNVALGAQIASSGGFHSLFARTVGVGFSTGDLAAFIDGKGIANLGVILNFLSAKSLPATVGAIALGARDSQLATFLQPVRLADLAGIIQINRNSAFLGAAIESLSGQKDLGAFLRAAETFITAIFNVITFSASDLRAVIGRPECEGGTAIRDLSSFLRAQAAKDITAFIESFVENNLGAVINTGNIIRAADFINVSYKKTRRRGNKFRTTDTITVSYSPFRGVSLGATIAATLPEVTLPATITPVFLPARVVPSRSRITAADLRLKENLDIQEIKLQFEGDLLEYFYVNGTQDAFIKDSNQRWFLNIRSFKPIATDLFGDFAAARVCRLGSLTSFSTMDEAVRSCIAFVLGLTGKANLNAAIQATGGFNNLLASLEISDLFGDLAGRVDRVFPATISATITSSGGLNDLQSIIQATASEQKNLLISVTSFAEKSLGAEINPI